MWEQRRSRQPALRKANGLLLLFVLLCYVVIAAFNTGLANKEIAWAFEKHPALALFCSAERTAGSGILIDFISHIIFPYLALFVMTSSIRP